MKTIFCYLPEGGVPVKRYLRVAFANRHGPDTFSHSKLPQHHVPRTSSVKNVLQQRGDNDGIALSVTGW
jgi:hypothetical protein